MQSTCYKGAYVFIGQAHTPCAIQCWPHNPISKDPLILHPTVHWNSSQLGNHKHILILGFVPICSNAKLNPFAHALVQPCKHLLVKMLQLVNDSSFKFLETLATHCIHLPLHNSPNIFNGAQVRTVWRPHREQSDWAGRVCCIPCSYFSSSMLLVGGVIVLLQYPAAQALLIEHPSTFWQEGFLQHLCILCTGDIPSRLSLLVFEL